MAAQNEDHFSRAHWLKQSDFHTHSDAEIIALITQTVKTVLACEKTPVVLLDLDSTLYEVAPRSHGIIREWVEKSRSEVAAELLQALDKLELEHVGYSLNDTLHALGLDIKDPKIIRTAALIKSYWWPRFFSNEYLPLDRPYPGSVEFATQLHKMGALLVYLTGRERAKMETGTLQNLKRDHFPLGDRTILWMKDDATLDDLTYKLEAARNVRQFGQLVASFENEPRNLAGLAKLYPNAYHVFVETVCSDLPAPRVEGIYRLKSFGPGGDSSSKISDVNLIFDPTKAR